MQQRVILDVIIVGGGLSGLFVTYGLSKKPNLRWKLLEASQRLGGRLVNAPGSCIDMGGAWIWPRYQQPHIKELTTMLNSVTFPQPDDNSSTRIDGGAVVFVQELASRINHEQTCATTEGISHNGIILNSPVKLCKLVDEEHSHQPLVQITTEDGETFHSRQVVFSIPPKVLSESVSFDPPLSQTKQNALVASRTWMAGVTKVALVYPRRFWDLGSSNMSFPPGLGPAFQVYDGSAMDNTTIALTFFTHVPQDSPAQTNDALLAQQVAAQLAAVWNMSGKPYADLTDTYIQFHVHRWPNERFISGSDTCPDRIHPHPMPVEALATSEWGGCLLFSGTETDQDSPGVMEGAIGSAKRVLQQMFENSS